MRHDVRIFPAFTRGPREFYGRGVIEVRQTHRVDPEPGVPVSRPRNFVRCMPAFALPPKTTHRAGA